MWRDARTWWAVLAVISAALLLIGFERVVRQGVVQGTERRAAEAHRGHALWLCNTVPGRQARADCRAGLR